MVKCSKAGVYLVNGRETVADGPDAPDALRRAIGRGVEREEARRGTIAHGILERHNRAGDGGQLRLRFDSLTSHDITYVGIIQTARASGMTSFPLPYVLTNCHNSLCAVGGTINEDDHMFALSAAKKYGGIYVPTNLAVIHSYNREMMSGCGRMILGSDSHTRYGALGVMAVGEGGGELAKQLVGRTYDLPRPEVVAVYLTGTPHPGVGPQDVALSIIAAVYDTGYVKNKVMEFVGEGVSNLPVEFRNGVDVMTTETTCWSSVWTTDSAVRDYYAIHGRPDDYAELAPAPVAYYDGMVTVDLSAVRPCVALPFHPSKVYTIDELRANPLDILHAVQKEAAGIFEGQSVDLDLVGKVRGGEIYADQGIVAGCAGGTFDNLCDVADILRDGSIGSGGFTMSVYPGSQPTYLELVRNGAVEALMGSGVVVRSAFCGPCFGAGDTPANGGLSVRHTTRNFPNREGSKPGEGQLASVALMDARSIAATALRGGRLTAATDIDATYSRPKYYFHRAVYDKRVYDGRGEARPETPLKFGPNIRDWPAFPSLTEHLLLKVVSRITDPVTTTDELIPSGETASYRSNPQRLAEFTLSRKDPAYVGLAKRVLALEQARERGEDIAVGELGRIYDLLRSVAGLEDIRPAEIGLGSVIVAARPGDGSAREQAASCQRVLGGWANLAVDYATKRYRSNLINWGLVPLTAPDALTLQKGDYLFLPGLRRALLEGAARVKAYVAGDTLRTIELSMGLMTADEREILAAGCLINYYNSQM